MWRHERFCYIVCSWLHYKKIQPPCNYKKIVLFSDAAGGQNKNLLMCVFCSWLAITLKLEVMHIFSVCGSAIIQNWKLAFQDLFLNKPSGRVPFKVQYYVRLKSESSGALKNCSWRKKTNHNSHQLKWQISFPGQYRLDKILNPQKNVTVSEISSNSNDNDLGDTRPKRV